MSLSILGGSGYQRGVAMQETGINCESIEARYFPEVNVKLEGIGGETFVKAVSAKMSRDVTVQGEVNAATGIMAYTTTTACTVANAVNSFGDGTGTLLFDEATVTQNRTAWESANAKIDFQQPESCPELNSPVNGKRKPLIRLLYARAKGLFAIRTRILHRQRCPRFCSLHWRTGMGR